jgi:hypothetical protein
MPCDSRPDGTARQVDSSTPSDVQAAYYTRTHGQMADAHTPLHRRSRTRSDRLAIPPSRARSVSGPQKLKYLSRRCAPLVRMQGVLTGLFAVVGTLVGSVVTYFLQRRNAEHVERFAREQRLWQERLQAYSAFAESTIEYRRTQYDRWHRHDEDPLSPAYVDARTESYRLKAIARQAMFRVKLLSDDHGLVARADEIMKITEDLHHAADSKELQARGDRARQIVDDFISAASVQVQNISGLATAQNAAGYMRAGVAADASR